MNRGGNRCIDVFQRHTATLPHTGALRYFNERQNYLLYVFQARLIVCRSELLPGVLQADRRIGGDKDHEYSR
jgi:hypothetical protein